MSTGLQRAILLLILVGGGAWLLMSIDLLLGCLALSFAPFVAVGASLAGSGSEPCVRAPGGAGGAHESDGGEPRRHSLVRAFVSQAFEMARFDAISRRALAITHRRIDTFVKSTTTMTFAYFVSMGLVLWVGGEKVVGRRADDRGAGRLPRLHGHPANAGAPDRVGR